MIYPRGVKLCLYFNLENSVGRRCTPKALPSGAVQDIDLNEWGQVLFGATSSF